MVSLFLGLLFNHIFKNGQHTEGHENGETDAEYVEDGGLGLFFWAASSRTFWGHLPILCHPMERWFHLEETFF